MSCFYHPEVKDVAQCNICKKKLCRSCVINPHMPLCQSCFKTLQWQTLKSNIYLLILYTSLFSIGYKYLTTELHNNKIFSGYMLVAIVAGWKFIAFLKKRTNQIVVFEKNEGVYWLGKLLIATLIGPIIAPFSIAHSIFKIARSTQNILELKK